MAKLQQPYFLAMILLMCVSFPKNLKEATLSERIIKLTKSCDSNNLDFDRKFNSHCI